MSRKYYFSLLERAFVFQRSAVGSLVSRLLLSACAKLVTTLLQHRSECRRDKEFAKSFRALTRAAYVFRWHIRFFRALRRIRSVSRPWSRLWRRSRTWQGIGVFSWRAKAQVKQTTKPGKSGRQPAAARGQTGGFCPPEKGALRGGRSSPSHAFSNRGHISAGRKPCRAHRCISLIWIKQPGAANRNFIYHTGTHFVRGSHCSRSPRAQRPTVAY